MKAKKARTPDAPVAHGASRLIPLEQIEPDPKNVRQKIDKAKLKELTDSIQEKGVIQPILIRPHEPEEESLIRYRIIAGERRYRASQAAALTEIPAIIWDVKEGEELDLQLIENLQREDVHPLDEALGFQRMKEGLQLDVKALAQRLGKDARYIARRLALTELIPEARQDFRQERITLSHALEICVLAPDIQAAALEACYESKVIWDEEQQTNVMVPDKEKPVRHVRYLQEWIVRNVHLSLTDAPFQMDDASLRTDGLTCLECPQRSGYNKTLFADIKDKDTCLNPPCYQGKLHTFVQLQKTALEAKSGQPVVYFSMHYGGRYENEQVLSRDQYLLLPKRADRCRFAEQAICLDGKDIGRTKWICREDACKVHRGRISVSPNTANGTSAATTQDHNRRKQEIFDLKVDEGVRLRVFQEALPTYTWPLERAQLNQVALEFFERIPQADRKTIRKVLGQEEDKTGKFRYDREDLGQKLKDLTDDELAQFLMLCSFAHYGANPAHVHQVDQRDVQCLSQERGVNYTLIDAQVRHERCPKKYRERHRDYLMLVKLGKPAPKPTICERSPQSPEQDTNSVSLTRQATA